MRWRPLLLLELNDVLLRRSRTSLDEVVTFLRDRGYAVHRVTGTHDAVAVPAERPGALAAGPPGCRRSGNWRER